MKILATAALAALAWGSAWADEPQDTIRKALAERIPQLAQVDEIQPTAMNGLYEVRIGTDVFYSDATGNYLIQGELIDTRARRNLTEDRIKELTAISFDKLPLQDAIRIVRGNGERQLAVFEDPNCGYCKRFERDLQKVDNVTVHLFLYPILSPDSAEKSHNIWCAKSPVDAWHNYMLRDKKPADASCDSDAIGRNLAFGRQHKITGTPTLIFADGSRVPGAIGAADVEKRLQAASAAQK
jgi:thiol:disulfide interchange protein DsbC